MFINEINKGKSVKISVDINREVSIFSSFVFYVFDGCILVGKITRGDAAIDFKNHKVDISYICPFDNQTYIFKDCNIRLVKYKGQVYHHISTNESSIQVNRRRSYRQYLGIDGVVKIPNNTIGVTVKDISTFGCAFLSNKEFIVGDLISVMFKDEPFLFDEQARIVRIQEEGQNKLYGCEFLGSNPKLDSYIKTKQKEIENYS